MNHYQIDKFDPRLEIQQALPEQGSAQEHRQVPGGPFPISHRDAPGWGVPAPLGKITLASLCHCFFHKFFHCRNVVCIGDLTFRWF